MDAPRLGPEATRTYKRQVQEAATELQDQKSALPSTAVLLEPGIERFSDSVTIRHEWAFSDLPHCPVRSTDTRPSRFAVCTIDGREVLLVDGTLSLHEGFRPRDVVFPVRLLAEVGVDRLVFSNTADSVSPAIRRGALVLIRDHINFQGANPLVGANVEEWGPRFPDMTEPYDSELRTLARDAALENGVNLREGVYCATLGPNAGTDAENRMLRTLGADVVGTSTVPEVIAARHMDIRVLALSVVTAYRLEDGSASGLTDGEGQGLALSGLMDVVAGVTARLGDGPGQ